MASAAMDAGLGRCVHMSDYEVTVQLTLKIRVTRGKVDARGGVDGFSAALREYLMDADKVRHFAEHHDPKVTGVSVTVEESRDSADGPEAHTARGSSPT